MGLSWKHSRSDYLQVLLLLLLTSTTQCRRWTHHHNHHTTMLHAGGYLLRANSRCSCASVVSHEGATIPT